jgi:hypothetical protein
VDESGGMAEVTLGCARDGVPTRLRCAECQAPICPACFVRTPVGLRCPDCAVSSVPPRREAEARPRWLLPTAVATAVVVALGIAMLMAAGDDAEPALDLAGAGRAPAVERVRVGTGDLPRGMWALEARRNGEVCVTLSLSPGPPGRENCRPLPGDRPVAFTATSTLTTPSETVYLTWGLLSERTERVRVAPEGSEPWEVPALGAGMNLGGRFFVVHTTSQVTTFTALGADGSELGRVRSAPPGA